MSCWRVVLASSDKVCITVKPQLQHRRARVRWHRTVTTAEESRIERTTGQFLDNSGDWAAFYYAGFFDDKVHFELEESSSGEQAPRRAFKFNLRDEGPTRIAIKGFKLDIVSVDTEQLTYQWVSID